MVLRGGDDWTIRSLKLLKDTRNEKLFLLLEVRRRRTKDEIWISFLVVRFDDKLIFFGHKYEDVRKDT